MNSKSSVSVSTRRSLSPSTGAWCSRVGDRQLDLELTEARAAEPFDDRQLVARRKAAVVEPLLAVQAARFDDELVAFPAAF